MSVQERHRRERQARGQAILGAAAKVFARHGLDGATIEMVARDAEVAVGTIYLYFASRDDLYLSLIAERAEQVRQRYLDIFARSLDPLAELKAVASTYLDYLRESRELFLSQHSVVYAQLQKRLKRPSELRNFQRVMDLSHEVFGLWERTVRRAFEGGVIANSMGPKKTAAVIWASMNGAFLLMGDDNYFRGVTGLNPEHFLDEALESHLAASQLSAGHRNGRAARGPASNKSAKAVRTSRARNNKNQDSQEAAAPPSAH
jgi:AcrR family transcriptional regulator